MNTKTLTPVEQGTKAQKEITAAENLIAQFCNEWGLHYTRDTTLKIITDKRIISMALTASLVELASRLKGDFDIYGWEMDIEYHPAYGICFEFEIYEN